MKAVLIWGTQLNHAHNSALRTAATAPVVMIEHRAVAAGRRFHKQKLLLVFAAMRSFADELRDRGRVVHYVKLTETRTDSWFSELGRVCRERGITQLAAMRQNDRPPQLALERWARRESVGLEITPNRLFLTTGEEFAGWADSSGRLQLEQFYRWQRRRLDILVDRDGRPAGGRWNFDAENRKALPRDLPVPAPARPQPTRHVRELVPIIHQTFPEHPGQLDELWLPTTRDQALAWLDDFLQQRFAGFGDYEDAMAPGEPLLFHSGLSAPLNLGLLHPGEVVQAALAAPGVPLAALEGFVRQVIGWREFMFGLYHHKPADWIDANFLEQRGELPDYWWFQGVAPQPPLADVLARVETYGYAHHIERLMVLGNRLLLSGCSPQAAYDWFLAMFVDAYEWVMVPNVIGMSQYADGGLDHGGFATKPYIAGSNYLQRMGRWWPSAAAARESDWTDLYWAFLRRHEAKLRSNHRLARLYGRVGNT